MRRKENLNSRERVLLALDHKPTDRIPIATVCAGINPPARKRLEQFLKQQRDTDVGTWLRSFIDIRGVAPEYVGPKRTPKTDIWGVRRKEVYYGEGFYSEIDHYPLADSQTVDDLDGHRWPSTDWFDYSVIPPCIDEVHADGVFNPESLARIYHQSATAATREQCLADTAGCHWWLVHQCSSTTGLCPGQM